MKSWIHLDIIAIPISIDSSLVDHNGILWNFAVVTWGFEICREEAIKDYDGVILWVERAIFEVEFSFNLDGFKSTYLELQILDSLQSSMSKLSQVEIHEGKWLYLVDGDFKSGCVKRYSPWVHKLYGASFIVPKTQIHLALIGWLRTYFIFKQFF